MIAYACVRCTGYNITGDIYSSSKRARSPVLNLKYVTYILLCMAEVDENWHFTSK